MLRNLSVITLGKESILLHLLDPFETKIQQQIPEQTDFNNLNLVQSMNEIFFLQIAISFHF